MFNPITIPFNAVMLFNRIKLKQDVSIEDSDELGYELLWQGEPEPELYPFDNSNDEWPPM